MFTDTLISGAITSTASLHVVTSADNDPQHPTTLATLLLLLLSKSKVTSGKNCAHVSMYTK